MLGKLPFRRGTACLHLGPSDSVVVAQENLKSQSANTRQVKRVGLNLALVQNTNAEHCHSGSKFNIR